MIDRPDLLRLRERLAELGYSATLESFDRLVVISVSGNEQHLSGFTAEVRKQLSAESRACGFTHVALELLAAEGIR